MRREANRHTQLTPEPKPCSPLHSLSTLCTPLQPRLVRDALEGALRQLKPQCPAVVSSRRERSLARALPTLGSALAGILLRSEEALQPGLHGYGVGGEEEEAWEDAGSGGGDAGVGPLHQACAMAGCEPEGLEPAIGQLLEAAVADALEGSSSSRGGGAAEGGGVKRARDAEAGGGASQQQG